MKKFLLCVLSAGIFSLVACGPSAEEKQAAEKARQDSINSAMEQMAADSMASVQAMEKTRMDSMQNVMRMDSMSKAEMMMKKKPAPAKPKPASVKKMEDAKKVTGGRGH